MTRKKIKKELDKNENVEYNIGDSSMMPKVDQDYEATQEYQEGREDYIKNGSRNMRCPNSPYENGQKIAWLIGWLDARTADVLGAKTVQ
jgi:ribosome modulation factor